jgi:RHS repeat-associated protein
VLQATTGSTVLSFVPGLAQFDASLSGAAAWSYFHGDAQNNRVLTDNAASVTKRWEYDPFGTVRSTTGAASSEFQFANEQKDSETGLTNLRARYYDPTLGRFISRDKMLGHLRFPQSLNRFVYASNNPLRNLDPSGYDDGECGCDSYNNEEPPPDPDPNVGAGDPYGEGGSMSTGSSGTADNSTPDAGAPSEDGQTKQDTIDQIQSLCSGGCEVLSYENNYAGLGDASLDGLSLDQLSQATLDQARDAVAGVASALGNGEVSVGSAILAAIYGTPAVAVPTTFASPFFQDFISQGLGLAQQLQPLPPLPIFDPPPPFPGVPGIPSSGPGGGRNSTPTSGGSGGLTSTPGAGNSGGSTSPPGWGGGAVRQDIGEEPTWPEPEEDPVTKGNGAGRGDPNNPDLVDQDMVHNPKTDPGGTQWGGTDDPTPTGP